MQSEPRPKKLLEQVRDVIRLKHYSYRTEQTYVQWIRRYILFHNKRHPSEMGVPEIETFLTWMLKAGLERLFLLCLTGVMRHRSEHLTPSA